MKMNANFGIADPDNWALRSEFWRQSAKVGIQGRRRRQRNPNPLVLCGHGVSLRIENGALIVRDGFTHYPQEQEKYCFFPGALDTPSRILLLDGSGTLSFEVLSWLSEQGIALARVKWSGEVATVASGTGYASDRKKVQWQHDCCSDEVKRATFSIDLIERKLAASVSTLSESLPATKRRDKAIDKIRTARERLITGCLTSMEQIRGLEGECAFLYFDAWLDLPIAWVGTGKCPIPDDWREYRSRSSLANGTKPINRGASHPINAMLNYGYAIRLALVTIQAIADGYDPTIGVMHHSRRDKPAFALDLIEPERPKVDAAILKLVADNPLKPIDFVIRKDGVCRLSPQLARAVASTVL